MKQTLLVLILGFSFAGDILRAQDAWPETLPVKPGDRLEAIVKVLGPPTAQQRPSIYQPPIISFLTYCQLGLYIGVHDSLGLFSLDVGRPWTQPIFGIRIGDPVSRISEPLKRDASLVVNLTQRAGWEIMTSRYPLPVVMTNDCGSQEASRESDAAPEALVQVFRFRDPKRWGNWIRQPR